jgi:hypothetical protein
LKIGQVVLQPIPNLAAKAISKQDGQQRRHSCGGALRFSGFERAIDRFAKDRAVFDVDDETHNCGALDCDNVPAR